MKTIYLLDKNGKMKYELILSPERTKEIKFCGIVNYEGIDYTYSPITSVKDHYLFYETDKFMVVKSEVTTLIKPPTP